MNEFYNHHYITVDGEGRVTSGWSDGPHRGRDTTDAICLSDRGGYQFRLTPGGEENPPLYAVDGVPLYKYENGGVTARTEAEIEADRAAVPEPEAEAPLTWDTLAAAIREGVDRV